jgi:hypothetical protein
MRHHCLARAHVDDAVFVFDPNHAAKHDGDFFEIRALPWFLPS